MYRAIIYFVLTLFVVGSSILLGIKTVGWSSTQGQIDRLYSEKSAKDMKVDFHYSVNGKEYAMVADKPSSVNFDADKGSSVTVYYDPKDPGTSVLRKVNLIAQVLLLIGLSVVCGGIYFFRRSGLIRMFGTILFFIGLATSSMF